MNRAAQLFCLITLCVAGFTCAALAADAPPVSLAEVTVHFSPRGGCEAEAVDRIAHARAEVLVQAYSFTSRPITEALIAAQRRGVSVQVILDKRWNASAKSGKAALIAAGVPVFIDGTHPIAHNKVMVIDAALVLTGSFNFTADAENGKPRTCSRSATRKWPRSICATG